MSLNFHFGERASTVMHDVEKEGGDAPVGPPGYNFKISVSDVIAMLDRVHRKARALVSDYYCTSI